MGFVAPGGAVRSQFIALWVLWVIWELLLAARYTIGKLAPGEEENVEGAEVRKPPERRFSDGIQRAQRLARDLILSFLLVLAVNYFAAGGQDSVNALSWIFLGISVLWLITELLVNMAVVRVAFWVLKFGLLLAILIIAYGAGWGTAT